MLLIVHQSGNDPPGLEKALIGADRQGRVDIVGRSAAQIAVQRSLLGLINVVVLPDDLMALAIEFLAAGLRHSGQFMGDDPKLMGRFSVSGVMPW